MKFVTKNHTNLLPFNAKSDITFWWNIQVLTSGSYVWCVLHAMGDLEYCQMLKEKPCFRCGMQGHNKKVMVFCASVYEIVFVFFGWKKIYKVWQFFPNWYNWKSTRGSKTITKINLSVYLIKFNNKLYHNWNITISLQTCPEQWRQYHLTVCVYTFIQFKIKM